jgi:sulfoxide reductase heme-binding subunit YedZ
VTHIGALTPLAVLLWLFWQDRLGPVPIATVTRRLGRYALGLLLLSLVPTVVRIVTGSSALTRVRRALGLYAFLYAVLHVLTFAGLDYGFNLSLLTTVILESRREIVGLAALLILGLLALTSIPALIRALGKQWKRLHRLVYVAAGLVVLHYAWNYKELRRWPVAAGTALVVLLVIRLPPVARLLGRRPRSRDDGPTQKPKG